MLYQKNVVFAIIDKDNDIYRKYIRCAKNARRDKDKNGRISDWQTIRKVN